MDLQEIDNRRRITCNISPSNFAVPKNSGNDGFILDIVVTTRFENIYYHSGGNCWILYSITEGANPRRSPFLVKRAPLILGSVEQTLEAANLSIVLDVLEIPESEHGEIAAQIKQYAKEVAYHNDPPVLLPILVEIGKWSAVNITDHMFFGDYRTPINFDEEEQLDLQLVFEHIVRISANSHQPRYRPADISALNRLVENGTVIVEGDGVSEGLNCVICLDEMEVGTNAIRMHCLHLFHSKCILQWLSNKNECPICRQRTPVEFQAGSSSS